MKQLDTELSLEYWVQKSRKGEKAVYYDGFLMMDRQRYLSHGGLPENQPEKLKVAKLAWKLYNDGMVTLVQKKKDSYSYDYIAIKR